MPNIELIAPFVFYQAVHDIDLSNYGYARHFKFLKETLVVVPNQGVALDYDRFVNPFFSTIESNRKQNRELTQLRDWLLPC